MNRQNRASAACRWGVCAFVVVAVASLCLCAYLESRTERQAYPDDSIQYKGGDERARGLVLIPAIVFGTLGGACGALWRWTQPE